MLSSRSAVISCGIAIALGALGQPLEACNTPVFRYAMYNWAPAPFGVFYFYRGSIAKEDEAVHRKLAELGDATGAVANVTLLAIDVAKPQQLDQVPPPVKESWKSRHAGATPIYLVWGPWGAEVSAGRLDAAAVAAMVDSPVRARVGELLKQGNAAVLLVLACPNEKENQRAEAAVKEVIARASRGRIPVAGVPDESPDEQAEGGSGDNPKQAKKVSEAHRLSLALVRVSRTDPKEAWLVRMLMAVESDLEQHVHEPMVFGVYGRGRAMEPFVGAGITADNLTELVAFLAGACSCQVKERNPGVDLLFHWDWNATADALAATDPSQADRQPAYQEVAVETAPTSTVKGAAERSLPKKPSPAASDVQGPAKRPDSSGPEPTKASFQGVEPVSGPKDASANSRPPSDSLNTSGTQPALPPAGDQPAETFAVRQMWQLGLGLGLITVLVVVTGLIVLRRYSS